VHKRSCGRGGCHGGVAVCGVWARCIIKEAPGAGFVLCFEVLRPASVGSLLLKVSNYGSSDATTV
jgi:hypothetical protein